MTSRFDLDVPRPMKAALSAVALTAWLSDGSSKVRGANMRNDVLQVRRLNDLARKTLLGCRVLVTAGIRSLGGVDAILAAVQNFDAFSVDNDPYGEHDFGSFRHGCEVIFWKIDYYDQSLTGGSVDPTDPAITVRVLTIMLASEY